jgi:hypothetical protein
LLVLALEVAAERRERPLSGGSSNHYTDHHVARYPHTTSGCPTALSWIYVDFVLASYIYGVHLTSPQAEEARTSPEFAKVKHLTAR